MGDPLTNPKPPPTIPRVNDQGLIEYVDIFTGKVLAISSHPNDDFIASRFDNLVKIDTEDGPVWMERHLDPQRILKNNRAQPQYSLAWASLVASRLLTPRERIDPAHPEQNKPETLKEAVKALQIHPTTFARWRENEEFNAIINNALQEQAQYLQDEALITSRQLTKSADVSVAQVKIDTLMKQAKQANQQRFGDKQKVEHSGNIAHTIVVETGIRRGERQIPEGFEDAIRDATPIPDTRSISGGANRAEDALEEKAPSPEGATGARSIGEIDGQIGELQKGQAPAERKSFLDIAQEAESSEPVSIPDLTDEPF